MVGHHKVGNVCVGVGNDEVQRALRSEQPAHMSEKALRIFYVFERIKRRHDVKSAVPSGGSVRYAPLAIGNESLPEGGVFIADIECKRRKRVLRGYEFAQRGRLRTPVIQHARTFRQFQLAEHRIGLMRCSIDLSAVDYLIELVVLVAGKISFVLQDIVFVEMWQRSRL